MTVHHPASVCEQCLTNRISQTVRKACGGCRLGSGCRICTCWPKAYPCAPRPELSARSSARQPSCLLLADADTAFAARHYDAVREVPALRVQCDETRSLCCSKQKNIKSAKPAPPEAGDVSTWTATDGNSKLILSWEVGDQSSATAFEFMDNFASPPTHRVQFTTDGQRAHLEAVDGALGSDADCAVLIKLH